MFEEILARRPEVEFKAELEPERIEEFRERGFTSIPRITSNEELEWLGELYDVLFESRFQAVPGGYFDLARPYESTGEDLLPQILMPERRLRELRQTTLFRNGRHLASQLLGMPERDLHGWGHLIRKPPQVGAPLPWHQDEAYWDPAFDYLALGVWMPLDPATKASGCMRFLPGSHKGEIRKHRHIDDDPETHGLATDDVDESTAVDVPVQAGGATFHHCRLVHSSRPNQSGRVRRAYANEFWLEPRKRAVPADRPWVEEGHKAWQARSIFRKEETSEGDAS